MKLTRYIVRFIDAYGKPNERLLSENSANCWIKNWNWKHNEDNSGLQVIKVEFKDKFTSH